MRDKVIGRIATSAHVWLTPIRPYFASGRFAAVDQDIW